MHIILFVYLVINEFKLADRETYFCYCLVALENYRKYTFLQFFVSLSAILKSTEDQFVTY